MSFQCEYCVNYEEDPESGESICSIDLDEDEQYCFLIHRTATALFSEWAMNTLSCTSRSEPVSRQLVRFSAYTGRNHPAGQTPSGHPA